MNHIANHLYQSTLFAAAAALATLALRDNHARIRYWLWLAASLKFLVPFSLLVSLGSRVDVPRAVQAVPQVRADQIVMSFAPLPPLPQSHSIWPTVLAGIWLAGTLLVLARWFSHWLTLRRAVATSTRVSTAAPIPVLQSATTIEPGVFGIWRPVLLLPAGITDRLTREEMDAILAHELTHVRRRDNLTSALHMMVASIFWFHPMVWWIGARMIATREEACDEAVLSAGNRAEVYAQGIVGVCKFYVESPLACASGVSGADLRKRIEAIMRQRIPSNLTLIRKMILCAAVIAAFAVPVALGILHAQTLPPPPKYGYEVASVKPSDPNETRSRIAPGPQGGLKTQNTPLMSLLTFAYDLPAHQFVSVPGWVKTERFDVMFTADKPEAALSPDMPPSVMEGQLNRQRQRMQAVLRDRFGLVLREETRELPMYALTVAKGGAKIVRQTDSGRVKMSGGYGDIEGTNMPLNRLGSTLATLLGRPVVDETGLEGLYNFKLTWTPDPPPGADSPGDVEPGPSIFSAIQEQLGLKLEAKKGPVSVVIIHKIERPTAN